MRASSFIVATSPTPAAAEVDNDELTSSSDDDGISVFTYFPTIIAADATIGSLNHSITSISEVEPAAVQRVSALVSSIDLNAWQQSSTASTTQSRLQMVFSLISL
jgi:hypothetical protein